MKDSSFKEYIQKEKSLAEFKIKALQKTNKSYRDRLINKEKSLISFDFLSLNIDNLEELKDAISLFKTNKSKFLKDYGVEKSKDYLKLSNKIFSDIRNISVDKNSGSIYGFIFPSLSGKDIFKSDGNLKTVFFKRVTYMKLLLYFLHKVVKEEKMSKEDIDGAIYFYIFKKIQKFKDYEGLQEAGIDIGTSEKIIDLFSDLFTSYSSSEFFVAKKTENTNLLVFPIRHKGNEKIRPLYLEVFDNNSSSIFVKDCKFSNYFKDGEYWKCLRIPASVSKENIDFSKSLLVSTFSRRMMDVINETRLWFNMYIDGLSE